MRAPLLLLAAAGLCAAQQPSAAGWSPLGEGGEVRGSEAAFTFSYEAGVRRFAAAGLRLPDGLAGMRRIRFKARTGGPAAIGLALGEKKPGGGSYAAWFWSPGGDWQTVELRLSDFAPINFSRDPIDPNGRLDLDQVEGAAFVDLGIAAEAQSGPAASPIVIERRTGRQSLEVEGFQIERGAADPDPPQLDRLDRGFLPWVTLGGMNLRLRARPNPLDAPALEASYPDHGTRLAAALRGFAPGRLAKAAGISFDIASERAATVMVVIELAQIEPGPAERYTLSVFPEAGKKPFRARLRFADFEPDRAARGRPLDAARIKSIALVDVTGAAGASAPANTIWVARLEALE